MSLASRKSTTSPKMATKASSLLRDGRTRRVVRQVAGSDLSQARGKKKR